VKDGEELGLAGKWLVKASIRLDGSGELALAESTLLEVASHQIDEYPLLILRLFFSCVSLVTMAKIPLRCFNF
jgi:hypothetical protein